MSVYSLLFDHSFRITGDRDQSAAIVSASILEGITIAFDSRDATKAHDFMINRTITKSKEYARLRELVDYNRASDELDEPIGMIRQIVRGIREGRYY